MPRLLENPRTGERIVIRQSGAETNGELLAFDVFLQPGGHVPAGHVHPCQQERFDVVDGEVRFRLAARTILARPGDTLVVPPGTPHWFGNRGHGVAHLRVEVRPALRLEELFATAVGGPRPGFGGARRGPAAWCARLLDLALIPLDFQRELALPNLPAGLVTRALLPLAWLRSRLRLHMAASAR